MYEDIIEKLSDRRRVFDGAIIHVDHMTATLPNGKEALREVAVHIGAAAVVPVDAEGNVYLVRQFRAPLEKVTLEIPAGKLDFKGEDRFECAKRELREETGYTANNWTHLTDLATTPGEGFGGITELEREKNPPPPGQGFPGGPPPGGGNKEPDPYYFSCDAYTMKFNYCHQKPLPKPYWTFSETRSYGPDGEEGFSWDMVYGGK